MQKQLPGKSPGRDAAYGSELSPNRRDPIRWLVGCGILLIAAIAIGTAIMIGNFRDRAIERAELIRTVVAEASDQIQTKARAVSDDFDQAQSYVRSLYSSGRLDEAQLDTFANEGSFDRVTVALSLMCDLPIGLVERALVQNQTEQIIVLAKAIDLSWVTTAALLWLQAGANGSSRQQLDRCFTSFSRLQPKTAQTALQFYRMREKAIRRTV